MKRTRIKSKTNPKIVYAKLDDEVVKGIKEKNKGVLKISASKLLTADDIKIGKVDAPTQKQFDKFSAGHEKALAKAKKIANGTKRAGIIRTLNDRFTTYFNKYQLAKRDQEKEISDYEMAKYYKTGLPPKGANAVKYIKKVKKAQQVAGRSLAKDAKRAIKAAMLEGRGKEVPSSLRPKLNEKQKLRKAKSTAKRAKKSLRKNFGKKKILLKKKVVLKKAGEKAKAIIRKVAKDTKRIKSKYKKALRKLSPRKKIKVKNNPMVVASNPIVVASNPRKKVAKKKLSGRRKAGKKVATRKAGKKVVRRKAGKKVAKRKAGKKVATRKTGVKSISALSKVVKSSKHRSKKSSHKLKTKVKTKNNPMGGVMSMKIMDSVTPSRELLIEAGTLLAAASARTVLNHQVMPWLERVVPAIKGLKKISPILYNELLPLGAAALVGISGTHFSDRKDGLGKLATIACHFGKGLLGASVVMIGTDLTRVHALKIAPQGMSGYVGLDGYTSEEFGAIGNLGEGDFGAFVAGDMDGLGDADFGDADFGDADFGSYGEEADF